jgi:hypothetical protein
LPPNSCLLRRVGSENLYQDDWRYFVGRNLDTSLVEDPCHPIGNIILGTWARSNAIGGRKSGEEGWRTS